MTVLIDTQVLLWLINDDKRLGVKAKSILLNAENRLFVSYFSLFEITLKASIGKLSINPDYVDNLQKNGIEILFPKTNELKQYKVYSEKNKDPFDNMLITSAKENGLEFMTSDQRILELSEPGVSMLPASE